MRRLINENEIKLKLEEAGFKSVRLGKISLEKQIQTFRHAETIVGLHGGGFSNLIFCRPNTKIIELKPAGAGLIYANLAEKCKLNYKVISKKPEKFNQNNQLGFIRVGIDELTNEL